MSDQVLAEDKEVQNFSINIHLPKINPHALSLTLSDKSYSNQKSEDENNFQKETSDSTAAPHPSPPVVKNSEMKSNLIVDDLKTELENNAILKDYLKTFYVNNTEILSLPNSNTNKNNNNNHDLNLDVFDFCSESNQFQSNNAKNTSRLVENEKHSLPIKLNYDLNSIGQYVTGSPLTNGYIMNKINPGVDNVELSYLNRNKLLNQRLKLRKQMSYSQGLQPIIRQEKKLDKKSSMAFRLANQELIKSIENFLNNDPSASLADNETSNEFKKKLDQINKNSKLNRSVDDHLFDDFKKSKNLLIIQEK
jgi:hypothetical protein